MLCCYKKGQRSKSIGLAVGLLLSPPFPVSVCCLHPRRAIILENLIQRLHALEMCPFEKILSCLKIRNPALIHFRFKGLQKKRKGNYWVLHLWSRGAKVLLLTVKSGTSKHINRVGSRWDFLGLRREWLMRRKSHQVEVYRFGPQNLIFHNFWRVWEVWVAADPAGCLTNPHRVEKEPLEVEL